MSTNAQLLASVQTLIAASDALPSLAAAKVSADTDVNTAQQKQATAAADLAAGLTLERQCVADIEAIAESLAPDNAGGAP